MVGVGTHRFVGHVLQYQRLRHHEATRKSSLLLRSHMANPNNRWTFFMGEIDRGFLYEVTFELYQNKRL